MTIRKIVKPRRAKCTTCHRYDNDGGPLCMNVFCPGGN